MSGAGEHDRVEIGTEVYISLEWPEGHVRPSTVPRLLRMPYGGSVLAAGHLRDMPVQFCRVSHFLSRLSRLLQRQNMLYMHICTYIYIFIYKNTCKCIYIYIHKGIYINTNTSINTDTYKFHTRLLALSQCIRARQSGEPRHFSAPK